MRTCPFRPVPTALSLGTHPLVRAITALAITAGTVTCGAEDSPRRDVLAHLADQVILPAEQAFADQAAATTLAVQAVCDNKDPAAARTAWRALRTTWNLTNSFNFGPALDQNQPSSLDFWPVRVDTIEAAITAAPASIDAAYIDSLGTSAKGMPALEYLLFTAPEAEPGPRCAFMVELAADIEQRSAEIADAWQTTHAEALRSAGHGSSVYPSEKAGLDAVVNATIEGLYRIVKTKLDRPLGNITGSDPDGGLVESYYSGTGLDDIAADLDSFERVYVGDGLATLVLAQNPDLDPRILAQLAAARTALAAVPGPLPESVELHRDAVQTLRDEVDALRRLIKLDLASLLGVTLSLSDNDGD